MKTFKFLPLVILMLMMNIIVTSGQTSQIDLTTAEKYFSFNRYAEALPYFLKMLETDSLNGDLNFKIAQCYWNSRSQKVKAIPYFERASIATYSDNQDAKFYKTFKLLGDAYHYAYRFDEAISCYEKCEIILKEVTGETEDRELSGKIEMCRIGKALKALAFVPEIKKEGGFKNSLSNSSSVLSADQSTITFTFQRDGNKNTGDVDNKTYYNSVIAHIDTLKRENVKLTPDKRINKYETTIATSVDGQIVLTYRDEYGTAALYTSCLRGNHWTIPEKLYTTSNTSGWETNEYISADGSTLYFTSDRKGGYGGSDIYMSKKMPDGEWSKAMNLGPMINTPFDEEAPFIHPDGKTFYFSSNGRNKEANFEIYTSTVENNIFSAAVKVGFPIDTNKTIIAEEVKKDNISDNKKSRKKRKKSGMEPEDKKDNYMISFLNPNGIPLTLIKGTLVNKAGRSPETIEIEVKNNETGEILGSYLMDTESKGFAFILPPSKNNYVSFRGQDFLMESLNLNITDNKNYYKRLNPVELNSIEKDVTVKLNNVFFEPGNSTIRSTSKAELNDLIILMKENPGMTIEIVGMAECRSELRSNSKLCSARADSLIKYLMEKGIDEERLDAKGYAVKVKKKTAENLAQQFELRIKDYEIPDNKVLTTERSKDK
jgi:outer membrane protein OmpA-like peptidoglycan-associated protein